MADGTASNVLVEKRQEFQTKQKALQDAFELAKDGSAFDFSRKEAQEKLGATDEADAMERVKLKNRELDVLGRELQQAEMKEVSKSLTQREEALATPSGNGDRPHPTGSLEMKSFGQLYTESQEFKDSRKTRQDVPLVIEMGLKTLFQTSAGFAPESTRSGLVVPDATRPIQVLDLIPTFPISQASFVYMEETTRTHDSEETSEGGTYGESTFAFTQRTSPVEKITDSIPVTDEQLEDEGQVQSLLDQRLRFGLRQRLDGQVLVGDGNAPNLEGINETSNVQTQAKGTDPAIVAFMKALTKIRFTGRAVPSGSVMHPNDWQDILLTQNSNGDFLFGNPFQGPGPQSLFGIPVALSDAQTENTGLVGDFANFCRLDDRRGVMVQTGFVGSQFTEGKVTLRADLRAAFTVTRPAAFCQITGI